MDQAQTGKQRRVWWGDVLWHARASIGVFLLAAIALILPPQVQDMLSNLADFDDFSPESWWHAIGFHFTMILIALGIWYWGRAVLLAWYRVPDAPDVSERLRGKLADAGHGADESNGLIKAFERLPRYMALGIAAVDIIACARSEKYLQSVIALLWGLALYWLLQNRHALEVRFGLHRRREITPRPEPTSWLDAFWQRLLELFDHAPIARWIAVCSFVLSAGLFVWSAATAFWPHSIEWKTWFAHLLPGPSVALFLFGMAVAPFTVLTYSVDRAASALTLFGWRLQLKYVPVMAILLVLMGNATVNMNLHAIRIAAPGSMAPEGRASLAVLFKAWADKCQPGTGPVQPVIVAISGGASRAGMWGARVLDVVDGSVRASGSKSASIFAISSVSGGSYGTAAYEAMRAGQSDQRGALATGNCTIPDAHLAERQQAEIEALRADAIGPALAGAILGDMPRALAAYVFEPVMWLYQKVVKPGPTDDRVYYLRGNDRAAALEGAFETNWADNGIDTIKTFGETPLGLGDPYLSLFYRKDRSARGDVPLWITNGTDVQTGDRLITVPFDLNKERFCTVKKSNDTTLGGLWFADKDKAYFGQCNPNNAFFWYAMGPFLSSYDVLGLMKADIPISTALDNTSRFPFLSPSGELTPPQPRLHETSKVAAQIIDGGYFENEGIESAMELARWLRTYGQALTGRPVYPIVVEATADADKDKQEIDIPRCGNARPVNPDVANADSRASQFLVPLNGLTAVRGGHSRAFLQQAMNDFCDEGGQQAFFHFYLYDAEKFSVPLNWSLSEKVADYIWTGAMAHCGNLAEETNLVATLKVDPASWKLNPDRPRRAARPIWACKNKPDAKPEKANIFDLPMLKAPSDLE